MDINDRREGNVVILELTGKLDSASAPAFDAHFKDITASDTAHYLLQLKGLSYMSSAGLRSILIAAKAMKARNNQLALTGLTSVVEEVFNLSGFQKIVPVFADETAALAALK